MSMNLFEFLKINDFNVSFILWQILGVWPQFNPQIRHLVALRIKVSKDVQGHSLWPEAREYFAEGTEQVRY